MKKFFLQFCLCLLTITASTIQVKGLGPINGPVIAVCGSSNVAYSVPADGSVLSYSWSVPSGATLAGGQGTNSIAVNFSTTYSPANISLKATYASSSTTVYLLVSGNPTVPVIDPPGPYCKTKDAVYSVTSSNAATYFWDIATSLEFDILAGDSSQTYIIWDVGGTVQGRNTCGLSAPLTLVVNDCTAGVARAKETSYCAEVYPNPATDMATLTFTGTVMANYYISLLDITGREMMMKKGETLEGLNNVGLDVNKLARGMYLINLISGEHIRQIRFAVK